MDYHEICKSLDVGIDVLQKQFVQDASYAQLDRMDQLDFQGFVIYLITELLSILKETNEAEIDFEAEEGQERHSKSLWPWNRKP
jgi:hypothetical protein